MRSAGSYGIMMLLTLRGGVSEPLQSAVGELVYRVPSHLPADKYHSVQIMIIAVAHLMDAPTHI